jgi:hypothetical protein
MHGTVLAFSPPNQKENERKENERIQKLEQERYVQNILGVKNGSMPCLYLALMSVFHLLFHTYTHM